MRNFLASIHPVGSHGLYMVTPLSPTDPGFGQPGGPADPGYGQGHPWPDRPDAGLPGYGHPDAGLPGYGHPGNRPPGSWEGRPGHDLPNAPVRPSAPIVIPPPPGLPTPPITLPPAQPGQVLPHGSGIVVPLPQGVNVPTPQENTPPGHKPYVLWYGPGTQSQVVFLPPGGPDAQPK